jgi:hypothetical protein
MSPRAADERAKREARLEAIRAAKEAVLNLIGAAAEDDELSERLRAAMGGEWGAVLGTAYGELSYQAILIDLELRNAQAQTGGAA